MHQNHQNQSGSYLNARFILIYELDNKFHVTVKIASECLALFTMFEKFSNLFDLFFSLMSVLSTQNEIVFKLLDQIKKKQNLIWLMMSRFGEIFFVLKKLKSFPSGLRLLFWGGWLNSKIRSFLIQIFLKFIACEMMNKKNMILSFKFWGYKYFNENETKMILCTLTKRRNGKKNERWKIGLFRKTQAQLLTSPTHIKLSAWLLVTAFSEMRSSHRNTHWGIHEHTQPNYI